jgi:hypothetical protein
VKVLLALRPLMLRQLLERAIRGVPSLRIVASLGGSSSRTVVRAARASRPDVAVLDLIQPGGLPPAGRALLAAHPHLLVLLLTDRAAAGLLYTGWPPHGRGLLLESTEQLLQVLRDYRAPGAGPDPAPPT